MTPLLYLLVKMKLEQGKGLTVHKDWKQEQAASLSVQQQQKLTEVSTHDSGINFPTLHEKGNKHKMLNCSFN